MGVSVARLVTVHPALVHFTVGAMPLLVLAYAVAAARRSARWSFAGDVVLWTTTALTVATFAFGLVSNAALFWPGGTGPWRWVHLAAGALSLALLGALSGVRAARRARTAGRGFAVAVVAVALLIGFTGWVGGEVLVFHAGLAVRGAAGGALAPPVERPRLPRDFMDAMGLLRADLAAITDEAARMTADHPEPARFADAAARARHLGAVAGWLADHPDAYHEHAHHHGDRHPVAGRERGDEDADLGAASAELEIPNYAQGLGDHANTLAAAATAGDLGGLSTEAGRTWATCAGCHQTVRWRE